MLIGKKTEAKLVSSDTIQLCKCTLENKLQCERFGRKAEVRVCTRGCWQAERNMLYIVCRATQIHTPGMMSGSVDKVVVL